MELPRGPCICGASPKELRLGSGSSLELPSFAAWRAEGGYPILLTEPGQALPSACERLPQGRDRLGKALGLKCLKPPLRPELLWLGLGLSVLLKGSRVGSLVPTGLMDDVRGGVPLRGGASWEVVKSLEGKEGTLPGPWLCCYENTSFFLCQVTS